MSYLDITDAACIELARTIIANDYQGEDAYVDLGTCNTESLCKSLERIERQIRDGIAALPPRHPVFGDAHAKESNPADDPAGGSKL